MGSQRGRREKGSFFWLNLFLPTKAYSFLRSLQALMKFESDALLYTLKQFNFVQYYNTIHSVSTLLGSILLQQFACKAQHNFKAAKNTLFLEENFHSNSVLPDFSLVHCSSSWVVEVLQKEAQLRVLDSAQLFINILCDLSSFDGTTKKFFSSRKSRNLSASFLLIRSDLGSKGNIVRR